MNEMLEILGKNAVDAENILRNLSTNKKNQILRQAAEQLVKDTDIITNIELKTGVFEYPGIEQKVYDMLREFDMVDRIIISSFNHYSVLRMKAIDPAMKCGMLEESWLINAGAYVASRT